MTETKLAIDLLGNEVPNSNVKPQESKTKETEKKPGPTGEYPRGYADGFKEGFKAGLESNVERQIGFNEGVRHIVMFAEDHLIQELGLHNRQDLACSGKIPAWWIATLVTLQ